MKEKAIRFVWQHPATVEHLQLIAGIETKKQTSVWTSEMRRQDRLKYVGSMNIGRGRPKDVYCNGWQPKRDNLRHETKATDCCLALIRQLEEVGLSAVFRRGYKVSEFRPDWEMDLNGITYSFELCCGTMTRTQVQRRWNKYKYFDSDKGVLIIVAVDNPKRCISSRERLDDLIEWSKSLYPIALFTTHELFCHSPLGLSLWDAEDQRMRMIDIPIYGTEQTPE